MTGSFKPLNNIQGGTAPCETKSMLVFYITAVCRKVNLNLLNELWSWPGSRELKLSLILVEN